MRAVLVLAALATLVGCASGPDAVLFEDQSDPWTTPTLRVTTGAIPLPSLSVRDAGGAEIDGAPVEFLVCKGHFAQGGQAAGSARAVKCSDTLGELSEVRKAGDSVTVSCEEECRYGAVVGSDTYGGDSTVCRAAVHAGAIGADGGRATVTGVGAPSTFDGVSRNGVRARPGMPDASSVAFSVKPGAGVALPSAWPYCEDRQHEPLSGR